MEALFTGAQTFSNLHAHRQRNGEKMWCLYTMEYYSAIKKNELMPFAATWRQWHPTPVFLPGKSQGQRSLVGCSPWGCKRAGRDLATKQFIWRCQVLVEPGKVSLVSHRIFHCTLSICGAQASEGSGSAVGAGGCSHPWGLWDLPRQQ